MYRAVIAIGLVMPCTYNVVEWLKEELIHNNEMEVYTVVV